MTGSMAGFDISFGLYTTRLGNASFEFSVYSRFNAEFIDKFVYTYDYFDKDF